jgi:hypothetical protein
MSGTTQYDERGFIRIRKPEFITSEGDSYRSSRGHRLLFTTSAGIFE